MKILIVSHEYPPIGGGGANACMNLAREYIACGHEVDVVTVWFEGEKVFEESDNLLIYRLKAKRKYVEHCSFLEMLDYLLKALPITSRLAKNRRYDVCQVFFGIPSGPIGLYLKKKYNIPYIIRFGGGDIPGFQNRFSAIYKIIAPVNKLIWKGADALVANSEGLRILAEAFYKKKEISIIPNGANVRGFDVNEERTINYDSGIKRRAGVINLLFVSRLIERKGLQDIIPQLTQIRDECIAEGIGVKLHIVGDGPYRKKLEELVVKEGVGDIVIFYGQKAKNELSAFYENADIFIFPSRKEGMPNVVLEAMSYGLPIIMTPCQGCDELIEGNGIIAKSTDFGRSVLELVQNENLRMKYGERSKVLIQERFNWESAARSYLDLFSNIVRIIAK